MAINSGKISKRGKEATKAAPFRPLVVLVLPLPLLPELGMCRYRLLMPLNSGKRAKKAAPFRPLVLPVRYAS
jgi:hypothetical protein